MYMLHLRVVAVATVAPRMLRTSATPGMSTAIPAYYFYYYCYSYHYQYHYYYCCTAAINAGDEHGHPRLRRY